MTYRQFLKAYAQKRKANTPNLLSDLPITNPTTRPKSNLWPKVLVPSAAVIAFFAVLGVMLQQLFPLQPTVTPTPTPPTDVQISAISYRALQADATVLPKGATIERYVGARMVALSADAPFPGHEACTSVFYQLDKQEVFCVNHHIANVLSAQSITASTVMIHFYDPTRERVIFTLSSGSHPSYWWDMTTDTPRKLPVSLRYCPCPINTAEQSPYALLHSAGGQHDDIFLIDVDTGLLTNIVKSENGQYVFDPMEDERLVANNSYVLYTHGTGDGTIATSPARTSVLYHIASGNSYTFRGQVEADLSDRLVIQTTDGYAVYSLADHTVTPLAQAEIPVQYHYRLQQTDLYSRYSYRLNILNRLTGETSLLCDEYLVAHLVSPDYRYIYYYVRGENAIRVCDMTNGAKNTLPLFADVMTETESGEHANNTIFFFLWMNEKGDEIVLTYQYSSLPREDPEAIRREQENDPSYLLDALVHDPERGFTSIASLEPILKRFPELVTAYQGKDYLYVDYTRLRFYGAPNTQHALQIALEDYTSSMFYDLNHINHRIDSQFTVTDQYTLSTTARQETLQMLESCGVTLLSATQNYQPFFTDASVNELKLHVEYAASDKVLPHVRGYYVRKAHGYDGAVVGLEGPENETILRDFLNFSDTASYRKHLTPAEEIHYLEQHTYSVHCMGTNLPFDGTLFIGKEREQPFLVRNRCLAYISETDYQTWYAILAIQEPKCHTN